MFEGARGPPDGSLGETKRPDVRAEKTRQDCLRGVSADGLRNAARESGRKLGQGRSGDMPALRRALAERGYEPFEGEHGDLRLRNCPFHRLAAEHRDLVCGMNEAFLEGLLEGLERGDLVASLEPQPGRCCVSIRDAG